MYALVLWMKSKTTSIVSEECLCPVKGEGEVTKVKYDVTKRFYRAKIIKKNDDSDYLSYLRVTTDGEILRKGKNIKSKIALADQGCLKQQAKINAENKANSAKTTQRRLKRIKSFINDDSDSSGESDDESTEPEKKKRKLENKSGKSNDTANEVVKKRPVTPSTSRSETGQTSTSGLTAEQPSTEKSKAESQEKAMTAEITDKQRIVELKRQLRELQRRYNHCENNEIPAHNENEDPLITCRSPGNGRVLLCENYNIWIDQGHLMFIQRYKHNPKEMTRRLLKFLVGEENLKNMCARGHSKTRQGIPNDIVTCTEYYVNKKCTSSLTVDEFTDTINYLCGRLRNPKLPLPPQ